MLDQLLKTQIHLAAGLIVVWSIIGIAGGLAVAALCYWISGRCGAWRWDWKRAVWFRALTVLWLISGFGLLGAWAGSAEGTLRGSERVVRNSHLRTEGLDRAGRLGATAVAWIDASLDNSTAGRPISPTEDQWKRIEAFERGESELPVLALIARLDKAEEQVVRAAADGSKERLRAKMGAAGNPMIGTLVEWLLGAIVRRQLRGRLAEGAGMAGIDAAEFFQTLPEAARTSGNVAALSHAELATHIVERALIPAILMPVRATVRVHQLIAALIAIVVLATPLAAFTLARALSMRATIGTEA